MEDCWGSKSGADACLECAEECSETGVCMEQLKSRVQVATKSMSTSKIVNFQVCGYS